MRKGNELWCVVVGSYGVWLWEKHLARELGLRANIHHSLVHSMFEGGEFETTCDMPNHENCIKRRPLIDIRVMDSQGKFGYPDRYFPIVDLR